MDIRTKLVFFFVAVSIASMAALGWRLYVLAGGQLREASIDQLTSLARFKADAVDGIVEAWHDRVTLVASRTQLRASLASYNASRDPAEVDRMRRILTDALAASGTLYQLWIHDVEGRPVVAVGPDTDTMAPEPDVVEHEVRSTDSGYAGVAFRDDDGPLVMMHARMVLDGVTIGFLHAVLTTEELEALSVNYEGLGETGETMVVGLDQNDRVRVLHAVRDAPPFDPSIPRRDPIGDRAGLVLDNETASGRAARGDVGEFVDVFSDYRGAPVRAVTRFVEETRWGVVVKIDEAEERQPVVDFRERSVRLGLTLGAYAILVGILLGFRFTQPILGLTKASEDLRAGKLDTRVPVKREDEVGFLAQTFNQMAEELEDKVEQLDEYRFFFDVSIDMMCIASTDGYFKRINEAFTRELGWSEEHLLGRPFLDMVHPDDLDRTVKEVEKLAGGVPTIRFENRFSCADGSYKWLRWNSFPDPKTGRLYAIARPIAAQEKYL